MTTIKKLPNPSETFRNVARFVNDFDVASVPADVLQTAKLLLLDLIGVVAAGSKLAAGRIARDHAVNYWAAGPGIPAARLLFDGRPTSLPGFGFAMATQLDNLDAHDGWQPSKGHAGAALFPALCAFAEAEAALSGREALAAMVIGYEIAYRAAIALHTTVSDYHTSGAWNALGCAAIGARIRQLNATQLRHALGIAEYHGPRSQMMREIANPTMLHDGTGWGTPTGIFAALMAEDGFEGAPAATVEFEDATFAWQDLGENWLTNQQYIKPYPICRWAHAPIDAALMLREKYNLTPEMIAAVTVETFVYSAELNGDVPTTSSIAQYSLAWPVAAALARGHVGVDEVLEASFTDPILIDLTRRTKPRIRQDLEACYPAQRLANVIIQLQDGRVVESGVTEASGGPVPQPTAAEVIEKYRVYAGTILPTSRVEQIEAAVLTLDQERADFKALLNLLTTAIIPD